MNTSLLDYHLPVDRIAQAPAEPRESAKLLVYHRATGAREHLHIQDLPRFFSPHDVLVINVASVRRARLHGTLRRTKSQREVFLLGEGHGEQAGLWEAFIKGSIRAGDTIDLPEGVTATVHQRSEMKSWWIRLSLSLSDASLYLERVGEVPLPPYIHSHGHEDAYETAYANPSERRSVAAPTAGFHLTPPLLETLAGQGVEREEVILDVGRGTFQPVTTPILEQHVMHGEHVHISPETAEGLTTARRIGKRIVAVGTTTTRALESAATPDGIIHPFDGETTLFITPGYQFKTVDALMTNFHLPKSSLIALVAAFVGSVDTTLDLYREAIDRNYRFYSFGDTTLIL